MSNLRGHKADAPHDDQLRLMATSKENSSREPRRHHYVPEFILQPWAREWRPNQFLLRGYYWDKFTCRIRHRDNGVGAFCYRIDLLTMKSAAEGKKALLETRFFQSIDTKGSQAIAAMLANGPDGLSAHQRTDIGRLLLSLEARRPTIVNKLLTEGPEYFRKGLDEDPEILKALAAEGVTSSPSSFSESRLGSFEDRSLLIVQRLVDNPAVGERLINANWYLKRLRSEHGSLVLSDRPLIRTLGFDRPGAIWVLPLTPSVAFVVANHPENLRIVHKISGKTFIRRTNESSAHQAERYVFSVYPGHERTLVKHLRLKS